MCSSIIKAYEIKYHFDLIVYWLVYTESECAWLLTVLEPYWFQCVYSANTEVKLIVQPLMN